MGDVTLEPEGSIEISLKKNGLEANATLFFVFGGDWCNVYNDAPETEKQARSWFVQEVQQALEEKRNAARDSGQTERPSGDEDRGA